LNKTIKYLENSYKAFFYCGKWFKFPNNKFHYPHLKFKHTKYYTPTSTSSSIVVLKIYKAQAGSFGPFPGLPSTCLSWQHLKELKELHSEHPASGPLLVFIPTLPSRRSLHFPAVSQLVFCRLASWFCCADGAEEMSRLSGLILTSFSARKDRGEW